MKIVFEGVKGFGILDYVAAWYVKASDYMASHAMTRAAFVSTNSISQGEQVGVLWNELYNRYKIKIHFAHRTFKWSNEARGNAAVHVVIIGFASFDINKKKIFQYEEVNGEPHEIEIKNINPYLLPGKDFFVTKRNTPLCRVPKMYKGSQPTDGGNLLLNDNEKNEFITQEPQASKFIRPFISAKEFLHKNKRWCFWLVNATPNEIRNCPQLLKRIKAVKEFRLASSKAATVKWAQMPMFFTENRQPESEYILIPRHSSENRKYIPFGFFDKNNIVADSCNSVPGANFYHFGVLSSLMHMDWVKYVCGRLESRYRYSNDIVYNNTIYKSLIVRIVSK